MVCFVHICTYVFLSNLVLYHLVQNENFEERFSIDTKIERKTPLRNQRGEAFYSQNKPLEN